MYIFTYNYYYITFETMINDLLRFRIEFKLELYPSM